jgi:membrane protein
VGFVLGVAVNTRLAVAVLTGLPRLRMRPRRVIGPALLVAAGLEVIKTIGAFFIQRAQSSPAYQVVAAAVGLLFFLNVLNQLILFATALTATSTLGTVTDLASAAPQVEPTERPLHITRQRPARDGLPQTRRRRQARKRR